MPGLSAARSLIHAGALASALAALSHSCAEPLLIGNLQPGTVTRTAPMSVERSAHTATTLADGKVLIVGGFTGEALAAHSAELYDPALARFSPLPRLILPRHSHTATTLPDGKILIVGGYGAGNSVTASAEATGSLIAPRAGHTAVPLANGSVLIAGGVGPEWSFLSSAELYDPATGAFTRTGDMTVARESHVAVRLADGRALIIGGHRDRRANITIYSSAELYDVATGTFRRVGNMHVRRHKHDAVLLRDGRVLVSGGSDERDDRGAYNSTELFDPVTAAFVTGPVMTLTRYKHQGSAVLLGNGDVLIAGGAARAELFDARRQTFTVVDGETSLAGQFGAASRFGDGNVLITGGYGNGTGPRASAWVYRP
jgi:hypothetical protein